MNTPVVNNYGSFDVVFKSGQGSGLKDIYGKKYIDSSRGLPSTAWATTISLLSRLSASSPRR